MTLDDLVVVGKLGNSKNAPEGFLRFKPNWNFQNFFFSIKEIFLVFKDHSVRYVTITDTRENGALWIKIKEKDVYPEIDEFRSANYCLAKEDIYQVRRINEPDFLTGMKVYDQSIFIGTVKDSFHNGAHVVISITTPAGKEVLIPQVDAYIAKIDKKENLIVTRNIEEFLSL